MIFRFVYGDKVFDVCFVVLYFLFWYFKIYNFLFLFIIVGMFVLWYFVLMLYNLLF